MKIKEYISAGSNCPAKLKDIVNSEIYKGYQPFGHVYKAFIKLGSESKEEWFFQPMVKYEEESDYHKNIRGYLNKTKERKVVDVCHLHQMPSIQHIILHRDELLNSGWTLIDQGDVEAYGWYLKMVKYE